MRPELLEGLRREPDPGSEEALLRTYRTRKEAAERSTKTASSSRPRPAIQEELPALPAAVVSPFRTLARFSSLWNLTL
jgi:hypothetical protein